MNDKCFIPVRHLRRLFSTIKRKYPVNTDDAKKLPVYEYTVSKKSYNRVFVFGNALTGALGIPFTHAKEAKNRIEYYYKPKRLGFAEKFEVTNVACGFGFTLFAVNSNTNEKLYGTGVNTDSQIGYHAIRAGHPLEIIYFPQPIFLPFKRPEKSKIIKVAAGRAHSAVLTDEGLFLFGNNAYGQCGREVVPDENYSAINYINHIEDIDGKQITDIECGQDHSLVLTEDGCVYSCGWGADGQTGLGHYNSVSKFTQVQGDIKGERIKKLSSRCDFVLALNDKGDAFGWGNVEYSQVSLPDNSQQLSIPKHLEMLKQLGKIIDVGAGGSFCVAINECVVFPGVAVVLSSEEVDRMINISQVKKTDHGNAQKNQALFQESLSFHTNSICAFASDAHEVFSWGFGLLGVGPEVQMSKTPKLIPHTLFGRSAFQPNNLAKSVTCGLGHATVQTSLGDLYSWGRNRNGCLGLRHMNDQYFPLKVSMGGYARIVSCGFDHTVALCKPYI